ncbi:hypothetical protein A9F13_02g00968 [Clavispora lusitaniae]|uniref:FHA domain-containing protein n=1 Tax=Clavispora lusitaniae TaxID=36911 RepID=A0AA91Q2Y2_CLALS|nr:hypothetical protein A9F13_02g00968 [Clavispora lusitaniae]
MSPPNSRRVDLSAGPVTVGRASPRDDARSAKSCNMYIRNTHLSKSHARLWADSDVVYVEDCGSTFGTVLNNQLLLPNTRVRLFEGDTLGFIVNRPSSVLGQMRSNATSAVPLEKLLNPRVQLQFSVAEYDPVAQTLVLSPVNDVAADASVLLQEDVTYAEATPEMHGSDDLDRIDESAAPSVDAAAFSDGESVESEWSGMDKSGKSNDTADVDSETSVIDTGRVLDSDDDAPEEEAIIKEKSVTFNDANFSDDDDDPYSFRQCSESEDSFVNARIEDDEVMVYRPVVKYHVVDCDVPGMSVYFEEDYNSEDDETYMQEFVQPDVSEPSDSDDYDLDDYDSDDVDQMVDLVSQCMESESEAESDGDYSSEFSDTDSPDTSRTSQDTSSSSSSKKRSRDEAELDEPSKVEEQPAPKRSVIGTVAKEAAKGVLYAAGTIVALAAYGSFLESQK